MCPEPSYRAVIKQRLREQAQPAHKFGHQPRLYALCQQLGASFAYDDEVVFAAAWLHDLGVFEGNRPTNLQALIVWDHIDFACRETSRLLGLTDFPQSKIPSVLQVIQEHQPQHEPTSIESTIVRDADILEQLGCIGVLRTAAKLGSDTRFRTFQDVQYYLERQLEELPRRLRLEMSVHLAREKVESLASFLSALRGEAQPKLY